MGEGPSVQAAPRRALDLRDEPFRTMTIRRAILLGPISPRTWRSVISLVVSLVTGAVFFVILIFALLVSGALSWIVGLGMLVLSFTLRLAARMAGLDRRRVRRFAGVHVDPAVLPEPASDLSFRQRQKAWAQSPAVRRLVVYQLVRLPVTAASLTALGFTVAGVFEAFNRGDASYIRFALTLVCFFGWPLVARLGAAVDVSLVRWLLGTSRSGQLSAEVQRLGEARTLAVESAETERRRIERDLHDGLQPKLVSLALEIGLAKARFERDPDAARSLIYRAHDEAKTAIEDLRNLVRGIHPSVLDERGLDAALSALIASCPVPVHVEVTLSRRPDQTREAVAYFVVAEAITNVTKHSGATRASVIINEAAGLLRVVVEDNGQGGARTDPGGGLAGLGARVTAIDGTFTVTSPPGGPTFIEAVIPCSP
ncbi:MAG TPA: histidine kinase [Streptosporangiaceae bacterium]|nr:histidine kinase [Streptosporangiaceae bacterium]